MIKQSVLLKMLKNWLLQVRSIFLRGQSQTGNESIRIRKKSVQLKKINFYDWEPTISKLLRYSVRDFHTDEHSAPSNFAAIAFSNLSVT